MAKPMKDAGMIQLLLTRLNEERLPEALKLKDKVDRGECLSDYEARFMKSVFEDADAVRRLVSRYPEYQGLALKVSALYTQITRKALENRQKLAGYQ